MIPAMKVPGKLMFFFLQSWTASLPVHVLKTTNYSYSFKYFQTFDSAVNRNRILTLEKFE